MPGGDDECAVGVLEVEEEEKQQHHAVCEGGTGAQKPADLCKIRRKI
jgi:hypothetical protein